MTYGEKAKQTGLTQKKLKDMFGIGGKLLKEVFTKSSLADIRDNSLMIAVGAYVEAEWDNDQYITIDGVRYDKNSIGKNITVINTYDKARQRFLDEEKRFELAKNQVLEYAERLNPNFPEKAKSVKIVSGHEERFISVSIATIRTYNDLIYKAKAEIDLFLGELNQATDKNEIFTLLHTLFSENTKFKEGRSLSQFLKGDYDDDRLSNAKKYILQAMDYKTSKASIRFYEPNKKDVENV